MYSQVSDLGFLPSVTSIAAVCILVYVFFGTYVEISVCILRKRETEREKDREREEGRDKEEQKEKGGRNFQVIVIHVFSFTRYCQITLQSDCANDTPILFSLANAFFKKLNFKFLPIM